MSDYNQFKIKAAQARAKQRHIQWEKEAGELTRTERKQSRDIDALTKATMTPDVQGFFHRVDTYSNYNQEVEKRGAQFFANQRNLILSKHPRGPTLKGKEWVESQMWSKYPSHTKNRYYLSPEKYYDLVPTLFDPPSENSISRIRERIQQGLEIDPLMLTVELSTMQVTDHEGRHRAIAARMEGLNEVPVYLFFRYKGHWVDVDDEYLKHNWHKPKISDLIRQEENPWNLESYLMDKDALKHDPAYTLQSKPKYRPTYTDRT